MASAFVTSPVVRHLFHETVSTKLVSPPAIFGIGVAIATTAGSKHISTALHGVNPEIAETCFAFFDSIKVSSTLIAGVSLSAIFTFTREVKETYNLSKWQIMLLRVYHMFSLLSFCLSMSSVLTSQAATTSLLLNGNRIITGKSLDAYSFLREVMNFEFLLTRWTFAMSLFSMLFSTTFRMFIEFGLFSRTRRTAGAMVASMMAGVVCFVISLINTCQLGLPGLWPTTKEVAMIVWHRAYIARNPLQIASMIFFGIAILCSLRFLFPGSIAHDQMLDTERYT